MMAWGRVTLLAVVALIVGLVVGFAATRWSDQHHRLRARTAMAHRHHPRADRTAANTQNDKWDPMAEMDRMQQEIDQSIHRAMQQVRGGGVETTGFVRTWLVPRRSMRDKGDHFEVRADLPSADKKDVKVTTDGDRQVRVNVTQHQEQNNNASGGQTTFREFGTYDQLVTLPEAADMKDMKVNNQNGELVITIPKAKAS